MKILVIDDHALVREGLSQILKGLDEQVEVLEAATCTRAFELAKQHFDLDLVLLDYHLPDMSGLDALQVLGKNHPELPVVMVSGSDNPQLMGLVLAHGGAGFVSKAGKSHDMLATLRQVLAGEVVTPPNFSPQLTEQRTNTGHDPLEFSPRQKEVLYLLMDGGSNRDIGEALNLSEETIKTHVANILRSFGVKTRMQVVLAAARHGYTVPSA